MTKVVIAAEVGGFAVSKEAVLLGRKYGWSYALNEPLEGEEGYEHILSDFYLVGNATPEFRSDPVLVRIVEELGSRANSPYSKLKIVEIPDGVEFTIEEADDGREWIAEKHRTWW